MALLPAVRPPSSRRTVAPSRAGPAEPGPPPKSRTPDIPVSLVLVLAGLLLIGVLVAALLVGGGRPDAPIAGMSDAGALTGWGRPVLDLLGRVLAVLTVGQLVHAALLAPVGVAGPTSGAVRALRGSAWSAAGWLLAETAAFVLTASALYSVPVTNLSMQAVAALLTELPVGRATLWVGLLLILVALGSALLAGAADQSRRSRGALLVLLAALAAVVVPIVLAGHSAAAADHIPAVLALSVHVVTASLWVGGLCALLLHGRDRSETVIAVRRFSTLALACVALLVVSGAGAALLVAGLPSPSWTSSGWVGLLLAKTLLLGLLAAMGWWHRRRTLPALQAGRPGSFRRLGLVEVAVMAATIAVSVALAAAPPPTPPDQSTEVARAATNGAAASVQDTSAEEETLPAAQRPSTEGDMTGARPSGAGASAPLEDMSAHDHGDLSVSVLIDAERFHVAAPVRPSQRVTVYNISDSAATITAPDGTFHAEVPPRTFITFEAPVTVGDHPFVSRIDGQDVAGFTDILRVRKAD